MRQTRIRQSTPLNNMAQLAAEAGERAKLLPPGKELESLLTLARESENASYVEEWLNSPGLLSPR